MTEARSRRWWPLLTAAVAVPLIAAAVMRVGRDLVPVGDLAITDLTVRDILDGHVPLVGVYSRYGWNHPGPIMFWLLAPFSALAGGAAWGTTVGAMALKVLGIGWSLRESERLGGPPLALAVATGLALALAPLGADFVIDPWNPWVAVAFLPAALVALVRLGLGQPGALPSAAIAATVLVQTHVGYVPILALPAFGAAVAVALTFRRARPTLAPWRRPAALTAGALLVLWAAPILDQFARSGNLMAIARYFVGEPPDAPVGMDVSWGVLAVHLRPIPPWLGGAEPFEPIDATLVPVGSGWLLVLASILAVGWVGCRGLRDPRPRQGMVVMTAFTVGTLMSVPRLTAPLMSYLVPFRAIIAVGALLAAGAVWWVRLGLGARVASSPATARAATAAALLLLALPTLSTTIAALDRPRLDDNERAILAATRALEGATEGATTVRSFGFPLHGWQSSIVNELARAGRDMRVAPEQGYMFGRHRVEDGTGTTWWIVEQGDLRARLAAGGAVVVHRTDNLPPEDQARLDELYVEAAAELAAAGFAEDEIDRLDSPDLELQFLFTLPEAGRVLGVDRVLEIQELNRAAERTGCQCAVFATPAGAPAPKLS